MTSCIACNEGVTPSGGSCPNGCNQPWLTKDPEAPLCVECPECKGEGEIEDGDFIVNCPGGCLGSGAIPPEKLNQRNRTA